MLITMNKTKWNVDVKLLYYGICFWAILGRIIP